MKQYNTIEKPQDRSQIKLPQQIRCYFEMTNHRNKNNNTSFSLFDTDDNDQEEDDNDNNNEDNESNKNTRIVKGSSLPCVGCSFLDFFLPQG